MAVTPLANRPILQTTTQGSTGLPKNSSTDSLNKAFGTGPTTLIQKPASDSNIALRPMPQGQN